MKNIIIIFAFLHIAGYHPQIDNHKACKLYLENLKIIKLSVDNHAGLNVAKISDAILFFERITHIKSQSPGDFIGRYKPTKNDYDNWKKWFSTNQKKLFWNNKEHQVAARPFIRPT